MSGDGAFQFKGFTLDLRRGCLLGPEGEIELRAKAFEVLCYLVQSDGRLVRKDEIIKAVWPRADVSDASLAQCVSEIRIALGDREQHIIRTVARRGYLFAAPVSRSAESGSRPNASSPSGDVPGKAIAAQASLDVIAAQAQPAERRQLTVLACEWAGLAGLSTRLDPEDLRATMAACQRHCAEIAARHRGRVARTLDDGVLIYFGHPAASESDSENAVRAGLDLLDMSASATHAGAEVPPLTLRIGIASGIVVMADDTGEGLRQPTAVGAPPQLARRLMASAPSGSLLIDQGTRQLAGRWFEYRAGDAILLDGCAEPMPTCRVLASSPVESRFEALRGEATTAALVGREEEIDLVLRRWRRAKHGQGQVVLVCGEPGIGKSRLIATMLERIAEQPRATWHFFCSPHHGRSALHPLLRQLERAAGLMPEDGAAVRIDKLDALLAQNATPVEDGAVFAELLSVPGDRYPAFKGELHERRRRIVDVLTRRLEAEARREPVIAVFEDVHWIDPTTLDVLGRMIESIAKRRVLLIVSFRPEFTPPWVGAPHVALLTLNRLNHLQCRDLIGRLEGSERLSRGGRDEIVARSDGIPLFIEELTKAAGEAGATGTDLAPDPAVPLAAQVPAALRGSLLGRLDRLGPAREVAQVAAAVGREFSYELLAAVAGRSETELTDALNLLADAGLVLREGEAPHASFQFKHALIQDAAYGTLLRAPRQELHARIAKVLDEDFPQISASQPEIVARHYFEAGLLEQAVAKWSKAGDIALQRGAVEEAIALLGKAIEVADHAAGHGASWASGSDRVKLQIAYGQTLLWARSMPETIAVFDRARELATRLEVPSERLSAYYGLWAGSRMQADIKAAGEIADTFLRDPQCGPAAAESAVAHRMVGTTLWHAGDFEQARAHFERALAIHDPERDRELAFRFGPDLTAATSVMLASALWMLGEFDGARRLLESSLARAKESGHVLTLVYVHMFQFIVEMTRGRADRALANVQARVELCREHGLIHIAYAEIHRAFASWRMGDRQGVLAELRRAVRDQRERGPKLGLAWSMTLLAQVELEAGEIEASLATVDAAIAESQRTGEHWYSAESLRLRGDVLLARDPVDLGAAEEAFSSALALAQQQKARSLAVRAGLSLAMLQVASGRKVEAQAVLAPVLAGLQPTPDLPEIEDAQQLLAICGQAPSARKGRAAGRLAMVSEKQVVEG